VLVFNNARGAFEPFHRIGYIYFGGRCGRLSPWLISIIAAAFIIRHVVIRPIICITFKYTCFHIATRRPIFGAGAVFRDTGPAVFTVTALNTRDRGCLRLIKCATNPLRVIYSTSTSMHQKEQWKIQNHQATQGNAPQNGNGVLQHYVAKFRN